MVELDFGKLVGNLAGHHSLELDNQVRLVDILADLVGRQVDKLVGDP
jgi:hypothetical protein